MRPKRPRADRCLVARVSVVMPVLNESPQVRHWSTCWGYDECIVVDGGTDLSSEAKAGAQMIRSERGRPSTKRGRGRIR